MIDTQLLLRRLFCLVLYRWDCYPTVYSTITFFSMCNFLVHGGKWFQDIYLGRQNKIGIYPFFHLWAFFNCFITSFQVLKKSNSEVKYKELLDIININEKYTDLITILCGDLHGTLKSSRPNQDDKILKRYTCTPNWIHT